MRSILAFQCCALFFLCIPAALGSRIRYRARDCRQNNTPAGSSTLPPAPPPSTPPTSGGSGTGMGTQDTSSTQGTISNQDSTTNNTAAGITPVTGSSSTGAGGSGGGSCGDLKGVTFNSGYNTGMFDTIGTATSWVTFGLHGSGGGSSAAQKAQVPMLTCPDKPTVDDAISMLQDPDQDKVPDWMLTFNELDYSYMGMTCTADPETAAQAIAPLIAAAKAQKGKKTKFVAPVTANPLSDWVPKFLAACNCRDFFSAYNIHIYYPTSAQVIEQLGKFRAAGFADKDVWLTELAPGSADPPCSIGTDAAGKFMDEVYGWAKRPGNQWLTRIYWNTGNQIGADDHNVCNSWLLDGGGQPGPLLAKFKAEDCGGGVAAAGTVATS